MKKVLLGMLLVASLLAAVVGIGCASLSSYITPAEIDKRAVKFVVEAGVADPNEFRGWANLEKAIKLDAYVGMAYEVREVAIKQMQENLQLDYNHLNAVVTKNKNDAIAREEALFADGGALSTLLAAGGFGAFAGFLGLMRKRPGDLTPDDLRQATEEIIQEVDIKESQFNQVVVGIEKFMKNKDGIAAVVNGESSAADKTDALLSLLKTVLSKEQDSLTRQEVGKAKAAV